MMTHPNIRTFARVVGHHFGRGRIFYVDVFPQISVKFVKFCSLSSLSKKSVAVPKGAWNEVLGPEGIGTIEGYGARKQLWD